MPRSTCLRGLAPYVVLSATVALILTMPLVVLAELPAGWQELPPDQFVELCRQQQAAGATSQEMLTLGTHARDTWLLDSNYTASAGLPELGDLCYVGAMALDEAQKQSLGRLLVSRTAQSPDLAQIGPADFMRVCEDIGQFATPVAERTPAFSAWMTASGEPVWKTADAALTAQLVLGLQEAQTEQDRTLRGQLYAHCWSTYLNNPSFVQSGDLKVLMLMLSPLAWSMPMADLRPWADQHFATVCERGASERTMEPWELWTLERVFLAAGYSDGSGTTTGERIGFPAYARAVLRCLAEHDAMALPDAGDGRTHPIMPMTAPTTDEPSRAVLKTGLVDEQGLAKLPVAAALAWSYTRSDEGQAWREYLDEKIADATMSTDQRASWLLARAFAECAIQGPVDFYPLGGRDFVEQAFASAESEPMRLTCLASLVDALVRTGEFGQASSLLQSVSGQFSSPEAQATVAEMQATIAPAEQADAQRIARQSQQLEIDLAQGRLDHLRRQKAELSALGRSEADLAGLQQSIDQAEQELRAVAQP
jgi:hypothetical protein